MKQLQRRLAFWREEAPLRLRSWWRRHWWPSVIRQLDTERAHWKAEAEVPDEGV